jgi:hypothetical protein
VYRADNAPHGDDVRWAGLLHHYALVLRALEQYAEAEKAEVRALGIEVRKTLRGGE